MTPETRGRKKLPVKEKKVAVYIMVPGKYKAAAQRAVNVIALKFCK